MSNNAGAPRKRWRWLVIAAIVIVLLVGAWLFSQFQAARKLDAEAALIAKHQGRLYFSDEIAENGDLLESPVERGLVAYLLRSPLNLNLHKVQEVRQCLEIAASYPGLWQIDVSESGISDDDLSSIRQMREIRHLLLNDSNIGDGIFDAIAEMPFLETLDLTRTKITAQGLAKWRPPQRLKTLMLIECDIGPQSLVSIKDHPNLETLRLCDTKTNSACVTQLGPLPALDELDLSGTEVDGECIAALGMQKKLHVLKLADTKFTADAMIELSKNLGRCRELDLSGLPLGDESIMNLCKSRSLKILTLSGSPITDEMAIHFFATRSLNEVVLDETKMTAGGIVRLAENTPIDRLTLSANVFSDNDRKYVKALRRGVEITEVQPAPKPPQP